MVKRRLEPAFKPLNPDPPSEKDLKLDKTLEEFMKINVPVEKASELRRREKILRDLKGIFRTWVKDTCLEKGLPEDMANDAGGIIMTSGSYRLAIHEPDADIDTICVAPKHITTDDFFTSLAATLEAHPRISRFNSIRTAMVPIINFFYDDIDIDLLFASLPVNSVTESLDIDDDSVLQGVDSPTEKAINGPRVTNMISHLVGTGQRYQTFLTVVRCVRVWAKQRGLYSNKMGYLGGVNFNILVCLACQLYPQASPSFLLSRFFKIMRMWKWPNPVQLVPPYDAGLGLEVWNGAREVRHVMPIITPAYPAMNSSVSVSEQSRAVMKEEFERGWDICTKVAENGGVGWEELILPSEFFAKYRHYLAIDIMASTEDEFRSWKGFLVSRLRRLVTSLAGLGGTIPRVHLYPKEFPGQCLSGGEGDELPAHSSTFFIGFEVDTKRVLGQDLKLDPVFLRWKTEAIDKSVRLGFFATAMGTAATHYPFKRLPSWVFATLGGREKALVVRKELKESLERKKEAKIAQARANAQAQVEARAAAQTAAAEAAAAAGDSAALAAAAAAAATAEGEGEEKPAASGDAAAVGDKAAAGAAAGGGGAVGDTAAEEREASSAAVGAKPLLATPPLPMVKVKRKLEEVSDLVALQPLEPRWRRKMLKDVPATTTKLLVRLAGEGGERRGGGGGGGQ